MNGDTGHLQRLTDEQVTARLTAYNPGGSLQKDIDVLRDECGDIIIDEVTEQFGTSSADSARKHYAARSTPTGCRPPPNMAARFSRTACRSQPILLPAAS